MVANTGDTVMILAFGTTLLGCFLALACIIWHHISSERREQLHKQRMEEIKLQEKMAENRPSSW